MPLRDLPSPYESDLLDESESDYPIAEEEEEQTIRDEAINPRRVPLEDFDLL